MHQAGQRTLPLDEKLYRCGKSNCLFQTNEQNVFKEHLNDCDRNLVTDIPCYFCRLLFQDTEKLFDHILSWHQQQVPPLRCVVSNCGFRTENMLDFQLHHIVNHGADVPYVCSYCKLQFDSFSLLLEHRKQNFTVYKCRQCMYRTDNLENMLLHSTLQHNNGRLKYDRLQKNLCARNISHPSMDDELEPEEVVLYRVSRADKWTQSAWSEDIKRAGTGPSLKENQVGKKFLKTSEKILPKGKTCTSENEHYKYQCEICKFCTRNYTSFINHKEEHRSELNTDGRFKIYKCDNCSFTSTCMPDILKHHGSSQSELRENEHLGSKSVYNLNNSAESMGSQTTNDLLVPIWQTAPGQINQSFNVDGNEKSPNRRNKSAAGDQLFTSIDRYHCDLCEFGSNNESVLLHHLAIHCNELHGKNQTIIGETNVVQCLYCPCVFDLKSEWISHLHRVHLSAGTFRCELCSYNTTDREDMNNHMCLFHNNDPPRFSVDSCHPADNLFRNDLKWLSNKFPKNVDGKDELSNSKFMCSECDYNVASTTKGLSSFLSHMLSHVECRSNLQAIIYSWQKFNKTQNSTHGGKILQYLKEIANIDVSNKIHVQVNQQNETIQTGDLNIQGREKLQEDALDVENADVQVVHEHNDLDRELKIQVIESEDLDRSIQVGNKDELPEVIQVDDLNDSIQMVETEGDPRNSEDNLNMNSNNSNMVEDMEIHVEHVSETEEGIKEKNAQNMQEICLTKIQNAPYKETKNPEKSRLYRCKICAFVHSLRFVEEHVKQSHTEYRPYSCSLCSYKSVSHYDVKKHHIRLHSGKGKVTFTPNLIEEKRVKSMIKRHERASSPAYASR